MVSDARLFVEGGGDNKALRTAARKAFQSFLTKAGLAGRLPRVIACGGRGEAYNDFVSALAELRPGDRAYLLVDSEGPVTVGASEDAAWSQVGSRQGDEWERPTPRHTDHLHLMVQVMESWFLADRRTLAEYYGNGFEEARLPASTRPIEQVPKTEVEPALDRAARHTKKGGYAKGRDSFTLLERIDPDLVRAASPWAQRLIAALDAPPS